MKNAQILLFCLFGLAFAACSNPSSSSASPGQPPGQKQEAADEPNGGTIVQKTPLEIVEVPAEFKTLGVYPQKAVAYKTPSGKIVAIGMNSSYKIIVARYNGNVLDEDFYARGFYTAPSVDFVTHNAAALGTTDHVFIYGVASADSKSGIYAISLTHEGEIDSGMYRQGMAFKKFPVGNISSRYTMKSAALSSTALEFDVDMQVTNGAPAQNFKHQINLIRPNPASIQAIPTACDAYTYKGGALNNFVHNLTSEGCGKITHKWDYLDFRRRGDFEEITIIPDGRCVSTKYWGRSCWSYEGTALIRQYVDRNWDLQKEYWSVIKGTSLCGYSGLDGTYFLTSKYPPTNANHSRSCVAH